MPNIIIGTSAIRQHDNLYSLSHHNASLLKSDVLLAPHHGGAGAPTPRFISDVNAADVIFSAGYRNRFNHPRPDIIERYHQSRQWRTDLDGSIHVVLADSAKISAWRQQRRRYWHGH